MFANSITARRPASVVPVSQPKRSQKPSANDERENQEFDPASPAREGRGRQGKRQKPIDHALPFQAERRKHAPVWIDDRRDARIGGAHHRQALLHRAELGLMKMLIRSCASAKPSVVGHVEEPSWSLVAVGHLVGENDLVADERPCWRRAWN